MTIPNTSLLAQAEEQEVVEEEEAVFRLIPAYFSSHSDGKVKSAMNKERLLTIADWLDAGAKHPNIQFDMQHTIELRTENDQVIIEPSEHWDRPPHHCHACVAGVAAMTYAPAEVEAAFSFNTDPDVRKTIYDIARDALGLTDRDALQLFVPFIGLSYKDITPQMAAKTIRSFVETGIINGYTWDAFLPPEYRRTTPELPGSAA